MVGILTTATLFCWTNVQDCKNTSSWYSRYYFDTPPLVPLCFFVHFPFSHRPWDADILSCACSFMFTADSMRGTNLDDTRIFRPVMRKQRCKVFFRVQSTEYRVQMTDDRWQMTDDRVQMTDDTDLTDLHGGCTTFLTISLGGGGGNSGEKHILRFISLQVTISHHKSLSAIFVPYLCNWETEERASPPTPLQERG